MAEIKNHLNGTIDEYLKNLSQRSITPGGGSVAALTAALGAGLNLMIINYSIKKEKPPDPNDPSNSIMIAKVRQEESLRHLSSFIDEDCKVFTELMAALKSGGDVQDEYVAAVRIPMQVCRECHVSMEISAHLLKIGNKNLISDVGCAVEMLRAAFYAAEYNVKINLTKVKDLAFVDQANDMLNTMKLDMAQIQREVKFGVGNEVNPKEEEYGSIG